MNRTSTPSRSVLLPLIALMTLVLIGTGCSGVRGSLVETNVGDQTEEAVAESLAPEVLDDGSVAIGTTATSAPFAFTAPELFTGASVSGLELYNDAPMIVTFVSPTCPVCLTEGPEIANAAELYPDITYLVVHGGADTDSYRSFADEQGLYQENVIHVEDESGVLWERFGVVATPSTLLVDGEGRVTQSTGALELQGHEQAANNVLALA